MELSSAFSGSVRLPSRRLRHAHSIFVLAGDTHMLTLQEERAAPARVRRRPRRFVRLPAIYHRLLASCIPVTVGQRPLTDG